MESRLIVDRSPTWAITILSVTALEVKTFKPSKIQSWLVDVLLKRFGSKG